MTNTQKEIVKKLANIEAAHDRRIFAIRCLVAIPAYLAAVAIGTYLGVGTALGLLW